MTTTPDIKLLKELAEKATPGPWRVIIDDDGKPLSGRPSVQAPDELDCAIVGWDGFIKEHWRSARGDKEIHANASFIAAANPQTIIALCERVEKLEAALKPFAEYCNGRTSDLFSDDQNITLGSSLARKQLTIGDCRFARSILKGEP
jgi:hypothetical protein